MKMNCKMLTEQRISSWGRGDLKITITGKQRRRKWSGNEAYSKQQKADPIVQNEKMQNAVHRCAFNHWADRGLLVEFIICIRQEFFTDTEKKAKDSWGL